MLSLTISNILKASFRKYTLHFKIPGGTSRGILHDKDTYFLELKNHQNTGIGECNVFKGLSTDDVPNYENVLQDLCNKINSGKSIGWEDYRKFPSIQFGYEQAMLDLNSKKHVLFPSDFTKGRKGIKINGLIWMGEIEFMRSQIKEKLKQGFSCLKLKIGTHWEKEKQILEDLRKEYSADILELRVDANGAFSFQEAEVVLTELARLKIHSIEQPIRQGNWLQMKILCENTPIPIALDEELIGVLNLEDKISLLQTIQPQYIILKPALIGGFKGSEEWIKIANEKNIGWWITSALESNIGLNAIAQWTFTLSNPLPQGLGTGGLFTNNIHRPLAIKGEELWMSPANFK